MTIIDDPGSSPAFPLEGRSTPRRLAGLAAFALSIGVAGASFAQTTGTAGGAAAASPPAAAQPAPPAGTPQGASALPPSAPAPQPGPPPAGAPYGQPGGYPPGYGQPGYPPGYGQPTYPQGYGPYGGYPPPGYGVPVYYGPRYHPYPLPAPPPPRPRRSPGAMVSGIILASSGGILALAGLALVSEAQENVPIYCDGVYGVTQCGARDDAAKMRGGVGMLIGGGLAIAVGIPLAVWGAARVPAGDTPNPDKAPPKASGHPDLRPEVRVGATAGSLSWRF